MCWFTVAVSVGKNILDAWIQWTLECYERADSIVFILFMFLNMKYSIIYWLSLRWKVCKVWTVKLNQFMDHIRFISLLWNNNNKNWNDFFCCKDKSLTFFSLLFHYIIKYMSLKLHLQKSGEEKKINNQH